MRLEIGPEHENGWMGSSESRVKDTEMTRYSSPSRGGLWLVHTEARFWSKLRVRPSRCGVQGPLKVCGVCLHPFCYIFEYLPCVTSQGCTGRLPVSSALLLELVGIWNWNAESTHVLIKPKHSALKWLQNMRIYSHKESCSYMYQTNYHKHGKWKCNTYELIDSGISGMTLFY